MRSVLDVFNGSRCVELKILAICGSPRKGNTYKTLKSIEENFPDIDYNIMMLKEQDLKQCLGCYLCIRLGEDKCPLKDDRDKIIQEISDSDGVIFASPVYVNTITSYMKSFFERTGFLSHRPRFFDKYAMPIAVCGMFGADNANEYMGGIANTYGFNMAPSVELTFSTQSEEEKKKNHDNVIKAMNAFIAKIEAGERDPPVTRQIVNFHIFKSVSELYPDHFVADYEFHKDLEDYYYDADINFIKMMMIKKTVETMMNKID